MRPHMAAAVGCLIAFLVAPACGGRQEEPSGQTSEASPAPEGSRASRVTPVQLSPPDETVKALVGRLDLERFKATIKGLTQFGDRRQGNDRNLAAVDWIEAQLRSFGCATERAKYVYTPAPPAAPQNRGAAPGRVIASGEIRAGQGGSRYRGVTRPTSVNTDPDAQPEGLRAAHLPAPDRARVEHGAQSLRALVIARHRERLRAHARDVHPTVQLTSS